MSKKVTFKMTSEDSKEHRSFRNTTGAINAIYISHVIVVERSTNSEPLVEKGCVLDFLVYTQMEWQGGQVLLPTCISSTCRIGLFRWTTTCAIYFKLSFFLFLISI
jgi:hypothetical protein